MKVEKTNAEIEEASKSAVDIEDSKSEEATVKITVTKEAGQVLAEIVGKVNDDFNAGRVHRQDVASFIIADFGKNYSDQDICRIRSRHFDECAMMEAMYRKMKETGKMPEFLRDALQKQFQTVTDSPRKKKSLTGRSTNDVLLGNGDDT
jgi:hypothetical protein